VQGRHSFDPYFALGRAILALKGEPPAERAKPPAGKPAPKAGKKNALEGDE